MVGRVAYAARNRRGTFVLPPVILSKRGLRPRASKDLLLRPVRLRGSRSSRRSAQGDKVGRVAYAARNRRGTFVLPPVILSKRGLRPRASKDLLLRPVRLRGSRSSRRSAQGDKGASRRAGRQKDECPLPSFVPNDTFPQGGRQVCGGGCASRMRRAGMCGRAHGGFLPSSRKIAAAVAARFS